MRPFFLLLSIIMSISAKTQTVEIYEGIQTHFGIGTPADKADTIWFHDSTVIMERKTHMSIFEGDSLISQTFEKYKYTFLDLRTKRAQNYFTFSDTATAITNFIADTTTGDLAFFSEFKCEKSTLKVLARLTDTTIGAYNYQRYTVPTTMPEDVEIVIYMLCNNKKYPFSLTASFKDKCNCNVTRYDIAEIKTNIKNTFLSYQIVAEELSPQQRKIFKRWRENAKTITLPLMTNKEVLERTAPQFNPKPRITIDWLKMLESIK